MLTSSDLSKWRETSGARKRHIEKFVYAYSPCVYMLTGHGQLCANYPVTFPLNMVISVKPSAPDMRSELLNNRNPIYIRLTHIFLQFVRSGFVHKLIHLQVECFMRVLVLQHDHQQFTIDLRHEFFTNKVMSNLHFYRQVKTRFFYAIRTFSSLLI